MPFVCLEARCVERSSELIAEILRNFGMRRKKQHAGIKTKRSNCLHRWCGKHHDSFAHHVLFFLGYVQGTAPRGCFECEVYLELFRGLAPSPCSAHPSPCPTHYPRAPHTVPNPPVPHTPPPCPTHHPASAPRTPTPAGARRAVPGQRGPRGASCCRGTEEGTTFRLEGTAPWRPPQHSSSVFFWLAEDLN